MNKQSLAKARPRKTLKTAKTANSAVNQKSKFDGQGSYTGVDFYDVTEKPVQDADDL